MKTNTRNCLDTLRLPDIYSLMLFLMYKIKDIPDFAVLSELCYLLDGNNITRLLTYFAGKTITFPTEKDLAILINALLLYQYINIQGQSFMEATGKLQLTAKQVEEAVELYTKVLPIIGEYNINRGGA